MLLRVTRTRTRTETRTKTRERFKNPEDEDKGEAGGLVLGVEEGRAKGLGLIG
jgi:hypothetical protein